MTLVLVACPQGLRGDLTKWLMEVSPGVYVGNVSARIREYLWERVCELCKEGRVVLTYSSTGEQRLKVTVFNQTWEPVDYDGLTLMRRPKQKKFESTRKTGWSAARNMYRARQPSWAKRYQEGGNDVE
ncbi:type I-E CRISPR-associated endoribonuclease Cas2e [Actinotignum urinale]|uniref:Type I-E CRISPR-associated endoribonuclease Cas2e n=1 Tax=Actinotignum urinale TaxID=190146 RepID=A0AAW9HV74_9ACTO|nr:type I-E CRISPR-associated endoribonuclease Cas2e [Actinotignum urinale]MDY5155559.1 type I-E CRISPR-associated endoribonuclease Cas2e [Actinotignum urinale]